METIQTFKLQDFRSPVTVTKAGSWHPWCRSPHSQVLFLWN